MNIMKMLLSLSFLLISAPSFAVNASFTKSASPGFVSVTNGGIGIAGFYAASTSFPSGTLNMPKTLLGIDWRTTLYPNNPAETVDICYYRPYTRIPVGCVPISRDSSGTITSFNNQLFDMGSEIRIFHYINGGPCCAFPAGKDTVTIHYSY